MADEIDVVTQDSDVVTRDGDGRIVPDGVKYKELSNGSVYDSRNGRIVQAPPAHRQPFANPEKARQAINSRWEKAARAARQGLATVSTSRSALVAWSESVGSQARLASDIEAGRASTEAARFVGAATGYLRDRVGTAPERQTVAFFGYAVDDIDRLLAGIPHE